MFWNRDATTSNDAMHKVDNQICRLFQLLPDYFLFTFAANGGFASCFGSNVFFKGILFCSVCIKSYMAML